MDNVDSEQLDREELTNTFGVAMVCPRCGSPHIQSVPVIVLTETKIVETETRDFKSKAFRCETKVTRSVLAERLAAPNRPSALPGGILASTVFVMCGLTLTETLSLPGSLALFVSLAAAAATYFLFEKRVRMPKLAEWRKERERWEKEFFCRTCGNKFVP